MLEKRNQGTGWLREQQEHLSHYSMLPTDKQKIVLLHNYLLQYISIKLLSKTTTGVLPWHMS